MPDLMSTSVSALLAFRRSIDVTSHNIANVGTDGYSRQRAELITRGAQGTGSGYIGSGTEVSTIRRLYDDLLAIQVRSTSSSFTHLDVFASQAAHINNMFADTAMGLSATMQSFMNAVQGVSNAPTSIPARQVLLSEAQILTDRLQYFDDRLREKDAEINALLDTEAVEISTLAQGIAQLNQEISAAQARYGQPPNDLLDQRDRMLDELATHLNVNVVPTNDGMLNVFVGNGQSLVLGSAPARLVTRPDSFDPTRRVLALETSGGTIDVTNMLSGGRLGGLLDFRREMLDPTRNALGRISVALAEAFNEQHHAGVDLSGNLGEDMFTTGAVETLPRASNAGSASVTVTRTDIGAMTEYDYVLRNTGSGWELRRADSGAAIPMTGSGTAADPFQADGLEIVVSGAGATDDQFLIRPTRNAVNGMAVLIDEPERIAAAAPIRTSAAGSNTGTGQISAGVVTDVNHAQLRSTVNIEFLTPTTYSINGSGSYAYTPGQPIEMNGWRVEITGAPAAGDRFTVANNTGGSGDNRNVLRLADVLRQPVLNGGTISLDSAVNGLVGSIGVTTRYADVNRSAQELVHQENIAARDSVSGVNLDEEAANLLRFQQAYQAAAQLIQVANSLFDTLLGATSKR